MPVMYVHSKHSVSLVNIDCIFARVFRGLHANLFGAILKHIPITSQHVLHKNPNPRHYHIVPGLL